MTWYQLNVLLKMYICKLTKLYKQTINKILYEKFQKYRAEVPEKLVTQPSSNNSERKKKKSKEKVEITTPVSQKGVELTSKNIKKIDRSVNSPTMTTSLVWMLYNIFLVTDCGQSSNIVCPYQFFSS